MKTAGSSAVKVSFSANPDEGSETAGAPTFRGEAQAVPEMLRRWRRFSGLTEHIPAKITELELSDRGSWTLTIESPTIPPQRLNSDAMLTAQPLRNVCVRWWKRIRELWKLWADRRPRSMPAIVGRLQPVRSIANRWRNIWHPCRLCPLQSSARPSLGDADGAADAAAEAEASSKQRLSGRY